MFCDRIREGFKRVFFLSSVNMKNTTSMTLKLHVNVDLAISFCLLVKNQMGSQP